MNKESTLSAQSTGLAMSRRQCLCAAVSFGVVAALGQPLRARGATAGDGSVAIDTFSAQGKSTGTQRLAKVVKSQEAWRSQLSSEAFHVTREAGTELAFSGALWNNHAAGLYHCVCCQTALYQSTTKYESGTGWPSFWQPISARNITESTDTTLGIPRTAVSCARCDAHLGHVFDDGPKPTGLRYCMNSVALTFTPVG